MKITRGQANPEVVNRLLLAQLEEHKKSGSGGDALGI